MAWPTDDETSDVFATQTIRFAEKDWRRLLLTEDDVTADPDLTEQIVAAR